MAQQTAKLNYLKISPRKVRLIADAIKGLPVQEAEAQLLMRPQRSAPALLKLLRSAVANAKSLDMKVDSLYVSSIRVDKGPMLKRMLPRAMGRATLLQKKMSHVILVLDEKETPNKERFNIVKPVKEKKDEKQPAKKTKAAKEVKEDQVTKERPRSEKKEQRAEEKKGIFKRFFRRKNI